MPNDDITTLSGGGLSIAVSAQGAQLMSLAAEGTEYLWQGDARWWPRRAPVLFPIVGCVRADETCDAGPCPMPRHGIARDQRHELVGTTRDALTYELRDNARTRTLFPYSFALRTTYRVVYGRTLEQDFELENTGDLPLPFCIGAHPAFNVPLRTADAAAGGRFEDYELRFARPWSATSPTMREDGLLDFGARVEVLSDADRLPLSRSLFATDTLVLEGVPGNTVSLVGPRGHGVRLDFADFPYLGVWSARGDAPFVALEPWTGTATATDEDAVLEHKRGIRILQPGQVAHRSFSISVF